MATRKLLKAAADVARSARKRTTPTEAASTYFVTPDDKSLEFFSSGCQLLDLVLGGGWCLGRMENIIGDKSTGKTLLAEEGSVNFHNTWPEGVIRYVEAESAFDKGYAAALGMPVESIEFPQLVTPKGENDRTVEWVFDDITATLERLKGRPCLYIVDSLDALSDREELKRDMAAGTYGTQKAKRLGEMFRRLVGDIEKSRMCLVIISQIRDKIGVTFGETKMRAGGHAMDFYATHCLWLAHIGTIKRTVSGIERIVGVDVRAKCKKNKVGLPFRECDFQILFGWGVDEETAAIEWLLSAKRDEPLRELGVSKSGYVALLRSLRDSGKRVELRELNTQLRELVGRTWREIEMTFLPTIRKY